MSSRRRYLHSVQDIARLLAGEAEAIAREFFPAGRRAGGEWCVGSLAGDPGQSLRIHIGPGEKRGIWADFAAGIGGDMLELVAQARFGGDKVQALRWARARLGLSDRPAPEGAAPPPPPRIPASEVNRSFAGKARALWLGGHPLGGTPAAAYLATRGVSLTALGRAPQALRYRPDVWCAERQQAAPAMLAAITRSGAGIIGCHRTFLEPAPAGRWVKARIAAPKKVLGQVGGGFIALWRGASGLPIRQVPETDTLAVAEGIEDALTIALHRPEWRVIAAVSAGNMANLVLPAGLRDVVFCWDRDGDNPSVARARAMAVERLLREGRSVREIRPPEGHKDFNAWHLAEMAGIGARRGLA